MLGMAIETQESVRDRRLSVFVALTNTFGNAPLLYVLSNFLFAIWVATGPSACSKIRITTATTLIAAAVTNVTGLGMCRLINLTVSEGRRWRTPGSDSLAAMPTEGALDEAAPADPWARRV